MGGRAEGRGTRPQSPPALRSSLAALLALAWPPSVGETTSTKQSPKGISAFILGLRWPFCVNPTLVGFRHWRARAAQPALGSTYSVEAFKL